MDNLRFFIVCFFKFLLSLAVIGAVSYFAGEYLYQAGLLQDEQYFILGLYVAAMIGFCFGGLVLICKLLRLGSINRFVVESFKWIGSAFVFVCLAISLYVFYAYIGLTGFPLLLAFAVSVVGGYVGYKILTLLVGFLGHEFEKLANALPSGRSVLFAEALNAGYSKPQTTAFIAELSRDAGPTMGIGGVYTTLILYVIPALILIAIACDVVYGFL